MTLDKEKIKKLLDMWTNWKKHFPKLAIQNKDVKPEGKLKESIAEKLGLSFALVSAVLKCNWPF